MREQNVGDGKRRLVEDFIQELSSGRRRQSLVGIKNREAIDANEQVKIGYE